MKHHLPCTVMALSLTIALGLSACNAQDTTPVSKSAVSDPADATAAQPAVSSHTADTTNASSAWGTASSPNLAGTQVLATLERSHGPWAEDTDFPIGRFDEQGRFHLVDTPPAFELSDTVRSIFADCEALQMENVDALAGQVSLSVTPAGDDQTFGLYAVTSPLMAGWISGATQPPEPGSAHFMWVYVSEAASLRGECEPGPGLRGEYDIVLEPGWNLRRTTFLAFSEPDEYGYIDVLHMRSDVVRELPAHAIWTPIEYTH